VTKFSIMVAESKPNTTLLRLFGTVRWLSKNLISHQSSTLSETLQETVGRLLPCDPLANLLFRQTLNTTLKKLQARIMRLL